MSSVLVSPERESIDSIKQHLSKVACGLLRAFPAAGQTTASERRGIIARYSAVLEGNFIYWMTGAYLSARTEEARAIIVENLHEEVRDCHPGMLRRFSTAAHACPDAADMLAVLPNLTKVRLFIGQLSPVPLLTMMAFFEHFIQIFMARLEDYAVLQGSSENEYTQVHGVCDITHSEELYRALDGEITAAHDSGDLDESLYEGVQLLEALIRDMAVAPAV